ncbi:MAG: hypothetical protein ACYDCN_01725 [Bacteroidia bacterium]
MKKVVKTITVIFIIIGGLANIDGSLSLIQRITNMNTDTLHTLYSIFKILWSIFLPALIIYLILIVSKQKIFIDNINSVIDNKNKDLQNKITILTSAAAKIIDNKLPYLETKIEFMSIVSHIRNKRRFLDSYSNHEYYRLPDETEEDYKKRLPEHGLFNNEWNIEYRIVKKALQDNFMKDKTTDEIDVILSKYYPFNKPNTTNEHKTTK